MSQSVLVITNSNDRRDSTSALRRITRALAEVDDTSVAVFFLRPQTEANAPWPGSRVVDDLRTWWPAALIERFVSANLAGRIRGLRLRLWLRQVDPDVVILDDGLGFRVVEHLRRPAAIINRLNLEAPLGTHDYDGMYPTPTVVVAPPGLTVETPVPVIREHGLRSFGDNARFAETDVRRAARSQLGLPEEATLIAGWGADGWLDGPDLFVRTLWALRERHGIDAHGVWLGNEQPEAIRRLEEEAARCGVADRFHHLPYDGHGEMPAEALFGDVVLLPTRASLLPEHLMPASVSGLIVVTFEAAVVEDDHVWCVEDLDVDAAAAAVARGLGRDRLALSHSMMLQVDLGTWTRHLLDVALQRRR